MTYGILSDYNDMLSVHMGRKAHGNKESLLLNNLKRFRKFT